MVKETQKLKAFMFFIYK